MLESSITIVYVFTNLCIRLLFFFFIIFIVCDRKNQLRVDRRPNGLRCMFKFIHIIVNMSE